MERNAKTLGMHMLFIHALLYSFLPTWGVSFEANHTPSEKRMVTSLFYLFTYTRYTNMHYVPHAEQRKLVNRTKWQSAVETIQL